jgi:hypothetical protein
MMEENTQEGKEIAPAPQETGIEPVSEPVGEKSGEDRPGQTFGQIARNIVLALLRLILIVTVIAGCGVLVYFGVPYVYNNLVRPVEENTSQMNDITFRQDQSEIQIADLQMRIATLEAGQATQSDSVTEIDSRVQTLEGADVRRNESLIELEYQSALLRAMELLSRARLFLYQSNFGLARSDVQAARNVLADMQATAPQGKQTDLTEALFRLDLAIKNLPDFPVAASDDLDIAWQILMDGYPMAPAATPTLVPATSPVETATPVIDLTATPTAVP